MTSPRFLTSLLLAGLAFAPSAHASQPAVWQFADDADFRRGNLDGLALHPTLGLTAAPKLTRLDVDAEFIHCWLRDGQKLWLGTGLNGKLFKLENGVLSEVVKVDGPLIASLASDGKGGVYAGLVGTGEILHVDASGKKETFIKLTDVQHIWALQLHGQTLFAGTGPGGKIFAVDVPTRTAKVYAETTADHVLALLQDGEALYAGTSDPPLLLRIEGEKQVRALASFPGVEVRSLARKDKTIYAVVNGGQTAVPMASMKPTPERPGTGTAVKAAGANKSGKDAAAKGKGAVWKRTPDGIVSRVLVSPEGMLSELGIVGKQVVAGAARGGRVVVGDELGDVQSLFDVKEEEILGVEVGAKGVQTLFTGKAAAVYVVGEQPADAVYTTEALQETGTAQWGRISTVGEGALEVETRSGFSEVPNDTWSPWQPLKTGQSQSPPANALQVRVKFASADARLQELKIFRQVANRAPVLAKIDSMLNKTKGTVSLTWTAEDVDGDTLGYVVQYRPRGGKQWLVLHDRLFDKKTMDLSPTDMPDGWYEVRVEATDLPSNGPKNAKAVARISKPFLIDRGRPEVTAEVKGRAVRGVATDAISRITRVDISVDGEPPVQAAASDGLFDQMSEGFELDLPESATKGPHTLLLQVTDEAGNTGALRLAIGQ
jgi:hypothetical protein